MISVDLETRSAVDLINEGGWNYALDPSTEVICMAYAVDYGEPEIWHPGEPVPDCFHGDHTIHAWNADGFERLIWDYIMTPDHDFPEVPLEKWRCTAFKSRCNNLPNKLENAARCLRLPQQKQARGRELIKLLCLPLEDGTFCKDPVLLAEMDEYCLQDVRTEMGIDQMLREPIDEEWLDFAANALINERGLRIDHGLCVAAQAYAKEEEADLVARIRELTDGVVQKARGEKLKAWVVERLTEEQERLLVQYKNGERKLSLAKWNRFRLLALDDLDPVVREVVECSDFAQKSSVGKFRSMALRADPEDNRVRGALLCNGASQSGRYSSRGAQVHNFPRDCMDEPAEVRADFIENIMAEDITDYWELPMMTVLSRMLRASIIPAEGHVFLDSDWSAIEGRFGPWLAGSEMGEEKLDLYRDEVDVYIRTAADTFRIAEADIDSKQRQVGKVQELALQYGGGKGAFQAMARGYGLSVTDNEAEKYKGAWRRNNPWAQIMWSDIERAVQLAIRHPGRMYDAGRVTYFTVEGVLCGGLTLFCQLPCGRVLTYPDVRLENEDGPYGPRTIITCLRAAFLPKATEKEWPRTKLWGGLLFENITQGAAASLLRWAVRMAWSRGLAVVFHVHDQLVVESKKGHEDADQQILAEIMNTVPRWADGLPVKADVDIVERFGK